MVDVKDLFGLLAFAVGVCGVIELVQYLIIYRCPSASLLAVCICCSDSAVG